jgi:peptidoglycan/xylan/chitin deacetylase (PgdA/CDA1 family)
MKKVLLILSVLLLLLSSCSQRSSNQTESSTFLSSSISGVEAPVDESSSLISADTDAEYLHNTKLYNESVTVYYPDIDATFADECISLSIDEYFMERSFPKGTVFDYFVSKSTEGVSIVFYDTSSASTSCRHVFSLSLTHDFSKLLEINDFIKSDQPLLHIKETVDSLYGGEGAFRGNSVPQFYLDKQGLIVYDDLGNRFLIPKDNFSSRAFRKATVGDKYQPVINPSEKVIALTFDDGPNYLTTTRLLNLLKEKDVKATFFVVGYNIPGNEHLLRRMLDQGCDVGIHSYGHGNYFNMSRDEIYEDLTKCSDLILNATNIVPHLVRAPFGNAPEEIVSEKEYYYVNWCVDPYDWLAETPEEIAEHIYNNARPGSIVLLHDLYQTSCDATAAVIDKLKNDGWRFVTVSEMFDMKNNSPSGKIYYGLGY